MEGVNWYKYGLHDLKFVGFTSGRTASFFVMQESREQSREAAWILVSESVWSQMPIRRSWAIYLTFVAKMPSLVAGTI